MKLCNTLDDVRLVQVQEVTEVLPVMVMHEVMLEVTEVEVVLPSLH